MQDQREEKFQKILDAAIKAIAECGYHQCQVSKIARLADVANGTIYLYFKNKEEILIRVFQERMGDFITSVREELQECTSSRMRLRAIVVKHLAYMESNKDLAIVSQLELRQSDGHVRAAIMEIVQHYFRVIEEVVSTGVACGEITTRSTRVARQLIFGTLDQVTTDWVITTTKRSLSSEVSSLMYLFEGALRLKED